MKCFVLRVLVVAIGGCGAVVAGQANTTTDQGVYTAAQAERGQRAYGERCEQCHGGDLAGSDFGDGAPALKRADFMAGRTLKDVFDRTKRSMPFDAPASLSDQAYVEIIAFLLRENGHPAGSQDMPVAAEALGTMVVSRRPARP